MEVTKPLSNCLRIHSISASEASGGSGIHARGICYPIVVCNTQVINFGEELRLHMAPFHESSFHQRIFNPSHLRNRRNPKGQTDSASTFNDVCLGDHVLDLDIRRGIEASYLRCVVDLCFVRCIGFRTTVPIKVISVNIEAHRSQRRNRRNRVQLEGGKLDGENLRIGINGLANRQTNVANFSDSSSGGTQNRTQHANGRGLAIRPSHAQPGPSRMRRIFL